MLKEKIDVLEKIKIFLIPIIFITIFVIYFTIFVNFMFRYHLLIPMDQIIPTNILQKFVCDFFMLPFPALLFCALCVKDNFCYLRPNKITWFFGGLFFLIFLIVRNLTTIGLYSFVYYFGVGFSEEVIFRCYFYNKLKVSVGPVIAVIISGCIWGMMHGILPGIINGFPFWHSIIFHSKWISKCFIGLVYIIIMKKSGSVWNGIFIHALVDYLHL